MAYCKYEVEVTVPYSLVYVNNLFDWCYENIGKKSKWQPTIEKLFWSEDIGNTAVVFRFVFTLKRDAIFFALRWNN